MQEPMQEPNAATTPMAPSSWKNNLGIPAAIVIAAAIIAGAIYMSGTKSPDGGQVVGNQNAQATPDVKVEPIRETDHVRGNPNASIVLIEYSDYDCPFCKLFHDTMTQVIGEYGPSGKVAWVYRHLPLEQLHVNARKISEASECVAELGGNDAFWKFTDAVNESRELITLPSGQQNVEPTDITRLSEFAGSAGVDTGKFELCLNSGKYKEAIDASIAEAVAANGGPQGLGTPFTLVFVGNEYVGPIPGAQRYEMVKSNIDMILAEIEGRGTTEGQ